MIGSIIELFGVRDMAEYNQEDYIKSVTDFKNAIAAFVQIKELSKPAAQNNFKLFLFRDFAYLFCSDIKIVEELIQSLRKSMLINSNISFRSCLKEFQDKPNYFSIFQKFENKDIQLIQSEHECSVLYSKMLEIKGVGISIDLDISNHSYHSHYIDNYWISNSNFKNQYNLFKDLGFTQDLINNNLHFPAFLQLLSSSIAFKKLSTYYIPIFINIFQQLDMEYIHKDDHSIKHNELDTYLYFDNFLLGSKLMSGNYKIRGIELPLGKLISRLFDGKVYEIAKKEGIINAVNSSIEANTENIEDTIIALSDLNEKIHFSAKRLFIDYFLLRKKKWIYNLILDKFSELPKTLVSQSALKRYFSFGNYT